mmetsp:Transcript_17563/g.28425  ORF Transcript_17563/g.28425 Transcript_17563/m.28425 type:complete len:168 (-) Transcript_17563:926-1429(-)
MPNLCEDLEYLDERYRLRVFTWSAGCVFSLAWWLFIDAVSQTAHINTSEDDLTVKPQLYLLGFGSTIAFFIISFMDFGALQADEYSYHGGRMVKYQSRALLIFAILLSLTCIIISIYVLSDVYIQKKGIKGKIPKDTWPGVAIFLQNTLIFIASFLMRVAKVNEDSY